jgi:hypothetical protein
MKAIAAVTTVTIYLVVYTTLFVLGFNVIVLSCLFLLSPLLIIGMVYSILMDNEIKYPDLKKGEEWGYRDTERESLGLF